MKLLVSIVLVLGGFAAETHTAKGIVLKTDTANRFLIVSCEAIPGYMDAMQMDFTTHNTKILSTLKPGQAITFNMVQHGDKLYAEQITPSTTATFEAEPMAAAQLTALNNALDPAAKPLTIGDPVPDFTLTDQVGQSIHLNQFQGKVTALTFGYSRCPNPNYCYRLSTNLAKIERRFQGQNLVLITIMIDPDHDQGATLAEYASVFKADPANWHFLTGPLPEIKQVCAKFGVNFWSVEGLLTHSLHTVIIDRQGRMAVNLEGNQFTPKQLGDLVQSVMERQ
jgi:protein SCO1/2